MAFPTHIVSAGGIVEDGNGNILLVKAHDDGWVYPGGITEVGENLIDGVIREIKEESGIEASVSHLISVVSNTAVHKWYDGVTDVPTKVMFDFVCKFVGGELAISTEESSECRWGGYNMSFPTHIVSAGGYVEDGQGNILLVKTRDGGWVCPGGQVEVGENVTDAVVREIKEESGIDASVCYLIGIVSNTGIFKWYDGVTDVPTQVIFEFVCKPVGGELLAVTEETTDSRWVPKEKALEFITHPALRTRYQAYLDFNGAVDYMEYITHPEFKIKHHTYISK